MRRRRRGSVRAAARVRCRPRGRSRCEEQLQLEYNSNGGFVAGPIAFNSDWVWSYELGEKWRSSDNRISVNAAGYFESWIGVQQVNPLNCGYVYTANAGNAHVYGGEFEVNAIVVRDLEATANLTYSHSTLVSSNLVDSPFTPGAEIQQVPKWSGTLGLSYRHAMTDELAFTARGESTYVGSRTDATYYINNLPSYDLTNVRAGVDGGRWSAVLFINNVADKRALLNNITQDANNLGGLQPHRGEPAAHHGHRPQLQVQVVAKPAAGISIRRRARRAAAEFSGSRS